MNKKKRTFLQRLTSKYRLVVMNDETFEEQLSFRLSRMNVYIVLSTTLVLLSIFIVCCLIFTPLKQWIPGYLGNVNQYNLVKKNLLLADRIDSIEQANEQNYKYINNIKKIMTGDFQIQQVGNFIDSTKNYDSVDLKLIGNADSQNRAEYENADILNLKQQNDKEKTKINLYFFKPIEGLVTNHFNYATSHFGIDIGAKENTPIKSTLDGIVVYSGWSNEDGNVIAVQHENNLITFYKHNSQLLKKIGTFVSAGDAIAIVGNTGETSYGPHLHFELWKNGKPLNPVEYITF
jgi:murein DD-endopeptidase MepM/ murein hydrolase activator NlpD